MFDFESLYKCSNKLYTNMDAFHPPPNLVQERRLMVSRL